MRCVVIMVDWPEGSWELLRTPLSELAEELPLTMVTGDCVVISAPSDRVMVTKVSDTIPLNVERVVNVSPSGAVVTTEPIEVAIELSTGRVVLLDKPLN